MAITKAVVLDFEATCSDDRSFNPMEIIEFPSILLHVDYDTMLPPLSQLHELITFQRFVRPIINPTLTPFCKGLTKITQDQVNAARPFVEVFQEHQTWLSHNHCNENNTVFVTCGDWDLKTMLPNQTELSNVPIPPIYTKWVNIKKLYKKYYGTDRISMYDMMTRLDLIPEGTLHRGIDDTYNIARIFIELIKPSRTLTHTSMFHGKHNKGI